MSKSENAKANVDIFFTLLNRAIVDQDFAELLHNHTVVPLPEDNPELSHSNMVNVNAFPLSDVIFLGMSKSEGSDSYDRFIVKETPIELI